MSQPSQADILAALSSSSFRKAPQPTSPYVEFRDPESELIEAGPSKVNSRRVYCFREGCGSLILLEKAGAVTETDTSIVSIPCCSFPVVTPHIFPFRLPLLPFQDQGIARDKKQKLTNSFLTTPPLHSQLLHRPIQKNHILRNISTYMCHPPSRSKT